ncbi:unnamed protein product [Gongylonema pulchrum]|uniref:HPt domain-containing protein n=1 Tax=Gongylonema pulchrum TaxID=637853 RepID=A0A183DBE6_9BILA|nr:unnamed protein product [Gongylonema pulchrum]
MELDELNEFFVSFRYGQMMDGREEMLSKLADVDDHFAEVLLQCDGSSSALNAEALNALRRLTLSRQAVPVACGSALRCAQSVSPILDLVVSCLPHPAERHELIRRVFENSLSALVFKIGHDKRRGQLTYARVYTGEMKNMSSIYNASKNVTESKFSVYIPHSDELQPTGAVKLRTFTFVCS